MIVCLCAGVSDRAIHDLLRRGVSGPIALGRACGAGRHCGTCRAELAEMSLAADPAPDAAESATETLSGCAA